MNLYIDTNIFLTFYHLTDDDLDELKKLAILIEDGQIILLLPEQTRNEFVRNREKSIYESINSLKGMKVSSIFPQLSKGFEEFILLKDALKNFEKHKNKIISNIERDAKTFKLNADEVITRIFKSAISIKTNDNLIKLAKIRFDLGNPPGKGKSYGDAINWEALLNHVNKGEDLFIITDDSDFSSILDKSELNLFLKDEWDRKKKSKIFYHKTLSAFFKQNFPTIELSDQLEKELSIKKLAVATTFSSAKARLAWVAKYGEFTNQQLNDIIEIANTNNQLYWINEDEEVGKVLFKLIENKEHLIEPETLNTFYSLYKPKEQNIDADFEDLPF